MRIINMSRTTYHHQENSVGYESEQPRNVKEMRRRNQK